MKKFAGFLSFGLFLLVTTLIQGQGRVVDTVNTVVYEKFKVPGDKQIVLTNIKDITFKSSLLDENQGFIKDIETAIQEPKSIKAGERGVMVRYQVEDVIEKTGNYFVKIEINYTDEKGRGNATAVYAVEVNYPTIASKLNIQPRYYPTEKVTFSFATVEFSNISGYSYSIEDASGGEIASGTGSVISLDDVLKNDTYVGRTFKIIGKYNGEPFDYKMIDKPDEVKTSIWEFSVSKPNLDEYVNWFPEDGKREKKELFISPLNENLLRFLYVYTGLSSDGNLVVIAPKITSLRVECNPAEFLTSRGGTTTSQGNFGYVILDLNQSYLDAMEFCDDAPVTLTFRFNTQYERNVERKYSATIVK